MKKIISLLLFLSVWSLAVYADSDKAITVDKLPANAKQFIEKYYKDVQVSYAKMDTDWTDKNYEVVFVTGTKVEFDRKGQWKEVESKQTEVPAGIVPNAIVKYVNDNYSGQKIMKIDRDTRDYEIKLSNGLELKFDMKYNLIDIDD